MLLWSAGAATAAAYVVGVARGKKGWPKVLPALLVAAAVLPHSAVATAAFVACAAGDALLLDKDRFFLQGLAAFLVGHLLLVPTFWAGTPSVPLMVAVAALVGGMSVLLVPRVPGALRVAIPVYALAIGAMILSTGHAPRIALTGAATFAFSDSVLATNRFVRPLPHAEVIVMTTYYAAVLQLGYALLA